ncbi:LuxR family transcriptional regulator [Actinomadura logoneensis]|uniref:LuxR family transcriptional regulator n=1 Tax=Actinomadura logoneensis TaxID=2293572 RepID=A0A372JRV1_9ACTN|nr:LuxR family transcriptional regulator [Actinomadura logoneensis]RFU42737.1 LuxR family transcriptional regulator [Actinomadura logoneensis]
MGRMPRPGRRPLPVPDPGSPLGLFARDLRALRERAGDPSYQALAQQSGRLGSPYSATSLRNAASGRAVPSWELTRTFVRACAAFAREHPERADDRPHAWDEPVLLDAWQARWREAALHDALADAPSRSAPRDAPRSRPPRPLTRFVGRGSELDEGARLLGAARLVTLTGVGGVGKTRLALRLAETVADLFPGGVRWAELAALTAPEMVGHTVAAALGVPLEGRTPLDAVAEALGPRAPDGDVLLVLDNCEHLLDATAALCHALLQAVPNLRVLASSRQPLNVPGEHVLRVGPLPVPGDAPPPEHTDAHSNPLPEDAGCGAAVELFVDRAAAAVPGFRLTTENRAAVERLCRRLEGLPLALELAARWLRLLSVEELLERLDQRLNLLGAAGADRTAPARHRTLRAVFDWSHDLCPPEERLVWERLSVCADGVRLADAEALCADAGLGTTAGPGTDGGLGASAVLDAIAGLVDKSLLLRVESGDRTRLRMLETVRLYGRECLAASRREADARSRHRAHYLGLARRAEAEYGTARQQSWLLRLTGEHANLRQALRTADGAEPGTFEGAFGLWLYWIAGGDIGEGAHWMRQLAERHPTPPDDASAPAWCRAMWTTAFLVRMHGDVESAESVIDRIDAVLAEHGARGADEGEWAGIAAATAQLRGLSALLLSDAEGTEKHSAAALRTAERPSMLTRQQALAQLGLAASMRGRHEEAARLIGRALEIAEASGESWHRSYLLWILAIEDIETGAPDRALRLLRSSLALKRRLGDRLGAATVSETLAGVLARCGDPRTAAVLMGAAQAAWQPAGAPQLWGFAALVEHRERAVAEVRRLLGRDAFERSHGEGGRAGLDRVLDAVLD